MIRIELNGDGPTWPVADDGPFAEIRVPDPGADREILPAHLATPKGIGLAGVPGGHIDPTAIRADHELLVGVPITPTKADKVCFLPGPVVWHRCGEPVHSGSDLLQVIGLLEVARRQVHPAIRENDYLHVGVLELPPTITREALVAQPVVIGELREQKFHDSLLAPFGAGWRSRARVFFGTTIALIAVPLS